MTAPVTAVPMVTFFWLKLRMPAARVVAPMTVRVPPGAPAFQMHEPVPETEIEAAVWAPMLTSVWVNEPDDTTIAPAAKALVPTATVPPLTVNEAAPPA